MSCGLSRHRGGSPWMSLTLLFSLPLPHLLRGGRSLPGHPGHYSVPVHLSALPLVGRVSVSERPLKDLVGVSGPEPDTDHPPKRLSHRLFLPSAETTPPPRSPAEPPAGRTPACSPYTMERPTPVWSLPNFLIRVPAFLEDTFP